MARFALPAVVLALGLVGSARPAASQYYYPYGQGGAGGGWGGWGGGTTAYGDIARGMGSFVASEGVYNYDTAQANAINANALTQYNQYVYESQQAANRRESERLNRLEKRNLTAYNAHVARMRDNPSPSEIANGSALNMLNDQLLDPKLMSGSTLKQADVKLSGKLVRDLPFEFSTDAITLCLEDMTSEKNWPFVLQTPEFDDVRNAYTKSVRDALEEDKEGSIKPATVLKVRQAVAQLGKKVNDVIPANRQPDHLDATKYVKGLAAFSKMLERPEFERVVSELESTKDTTVGHLLAFMSNYNLRFGPAKTQSQREAYESLYRTLSSQRNRLVTSNTAAAPAASPNTKPVAGRPSDLFQGIDARHLHPTDAPATAPAPPVPRDAPK